MLDPPGVLPDPAPQLPHGIELVTWPVAARALLWIAVAAAGVPLAVYLVVYETFQPGTPLSRLRDGVARYRSTTVLDRPQVIDGVPFPGQTTIRWEDPSHRRVRAAILPPAGDVLGVRATGLRRVSENGWMVSLAGAQDIGGWSCRDGEVELSTEGRLMNCELLGTPAWRGWALPEHTSVQPRPDLREVWLTLPVVGPWDTPLLSPVLGKLPWIIAFNEDGSPSRCTYGRENPYPVGSQRLSGDVQWNYDSATDGMGRDRPPVTVSGFVHDPGDGGMRRHVVLVWPGTSSTDNAR